MTFRFLFPLVLIACSCHPLEAVQDQVPLQLVCPESDGSAAKQALTDYAKDPEALRSKLVEQVKHDPVGVTCLLLDARELLLATGQRASEVYQATNEALTALGIQ